MMEKGKVMICVMLSFMLCFLCIGYAALSGELSITGSAEFYMPPIYISNVEWISGNGILNEEKHSVETQLESLITLGSSSSSTVVLAVTVKNRTQDIYGYAGTFADSEHYNNSNIAYALYSNKACTTRLAKKTALHPETTSEGANGLTFYVEFTYNSGYKPSKTETLRSILNFQFKTPIDSIIEDAAVNNAVDKFKDILNDHINNKDYFPLLEIMNTENRDRNISYVGNVTGADSNDISEIEELFDGQLKVNIEGQTKEVKFILKRENIDGNEATGGLETLNYRDNNGNQSVTGWEMVMYMTSETLSGGGIFTSTYKKVYAIVYTSYDGGQTWVQLGEMYQGEAQVVRYDGWPGNGSFSTDTWRSTVKYYNLATKQSIEKLIANIPKENQ